MDYHIIATQGSDETQQPSIEIASFEIADMIEGETEYESAGEAYDVVRSAIMAEERNIRQLREEERDLAEARAMASKRVRLLVKVEGELEAYL